MTADSGRVPIIAARVLCVRGGRLLLVRERHREYGHEFWSVPGGALEPGETPEEGARRELLEETGLTAGALIPAPPRMAEEAVFIGQLAGDSAELEMAIDPAGEVLGIAWHPVSLENPLGPLDLEYWGPFAETVRRILPSGLC